MDAETLLQRINLGEDEEIEFKAANGGLSKDVWETLSAFANTDGGYIVLGVRQNKDGFEVSGIRNPSLLLKTFWDSHNNEQKLSTPICSNSHIFTHEIDAQKVILIKVPRAARTQRPVYINNNPLTGTYKRNHEGDYRCTKEEVQQMLRDASSEPQDLQILDKFDLSDIDSNTLKSFRQRFSSREPDHPWLALDDKELLIKLGGWRRDRETNKEGLTIAGLLMFGCERSILDTFPRYHLDYQERLSHDPETRWTFRLTLDGKWEPNLFNFYYRVYSRLVNDINVPFQLDKEAVRKGETHVHEALREALVNSLIHADHFSSLPLIVIKFTDGFSFANPGRLRISVQQLYEGGLSDPRNPNLQKMFQMLGLGEKAGSGFGKILRAWKEQQWFYPLVSEKLDLELTSVSLPMISLIPEEVERELKAIVGASYCELTELERNILVLAHRFGEICNTDIQCFSKEHPRDIGECLKRLVTKQWLERSGRGRGTYYSLSNQEKPDDLLLLLSRSKYNEPNSEHNEPNSDYVKTVSLEEIAAPVKHKKRVSPKLMRATILQLCSEKYLLLKTLAELLQRSPDTLRTHYINLMLDEGLLELKYPEHPNHPQQGYKATCSR
ncbi:transcriptional regulator [Scytonema sp. UIC 10036]|uniref:RNA-binding domain-containing protein n=1 Tax=Scytonema sp. UIC 10036 TaxID=2304196 RepID=UPI0012DAC60C|nr:RNA-binding domain-containing protein [Scytonema sp. UIC 10036]MUG99671.1 transcriptional regulator [Scytonema sp. UIC 10036]